MIQTLYFTKMHGAGNDFIVLNAMHGLPNLSIAQFQFLSDRRYGIGCDQFLIIAPPHNHINDFSYRIINSDGSEVEQCGNGARCFMRFIRDEGLTQKNTVRVEVATGVIILQELPNGLIEVNMGAPRFEPEALPFNPEGLNTLKTNDFITYKLPLSSRLSLPEDNTYHNKDIEINIVSMGNPHMVQRVDDVDGTEVAKNGAYLEHHPAFPKRVNVGFMQVLDKHTIKLRVWERGSGETLACGTGACAAAVVGIAQGLLQSPVTVQARGGTLQIEWAGSTHDSVMMCGPAISVFKGSITLDI